MSPWQLIFVLEKSSPSFKEMLYPRQLRCPLEGRVVQAIEEHWPAYFPTRKECRGSNWTLGIPENEPLYKPRVGSIQALDAWKKKIKGTIAVGRAYRADTSWKRFVEISKNSSRLRPFLEDFEPLADFLIWEESMWPRHGGSLVSMEDSLRGGMEAILTPNSVYHFAAPQRLRFIRSKRPLIEKLQMIGLMRQLYDRPLMVLAILQDCANRSDHSSFWLNLEDHIAAIIKSPCRFTFRTTWFEHAMQAVGAIKRSGKSSPRKWARRLLGDKHNDFLAVNAKAVEVNGWIKSKKQPSVKNIRRTWQAIAATAELNPEQDAVGMDRWLFSWMITVWLEKHFAEIETQFKRDPRKIKRYYRRFFLYLKLVKTKPNGKGAGGLMARRP
jgi:hypothetical protein